MNGTPYFNIYNTQPNVDRINTQIAELEKMKQQMQQQSVSQPTNLTQNFQITPSNSYNMKYAKSLDEVNRSIVYTETPFFSNDMSVVWIKDQKNNVKIYEMNEIIPKDDKDIMIENLQQQLNELRKEVKTNAKPNIDDVDEQHKSQEPSSDKVYRTSPKKSKQPSGIN